MATIQKVLLIPQMGLLDEDNLVKWAHSLPSEMIADSNRTAVKVFQDNLYERNMPRSNEAMIAVMPFTFFPDDKLFRRSVYLFALLAQMDNAIAGQIAMTSRGSEFIHGILMHCMRISQKENVMSVGYPLRSHPVVNTISMTAVISMISDKTVKGQDPEKGLN